MKPKLIKAKIEKVINSLCTEFPWLSYHNVSSQCQPLIKIDEEVTGINKDFDDLCIQNTAGNSEGQTTNCLKWSLG